MSEVAADVLASLSTPDQVDSRIGPLEFTDGAPARKSVETLYDHLDYVHGLNAFLTAFPGASTQAIRQGFHGIGVRAASRLCTGAKRMLTGSMSRSRGTSVSSRPSSSP